MAEIDILSDSYIAAANDELMGSTCKVPGCPSGVSGKVGTAHVEKRYALAGGSLSGHNAHPAQVDLFYVCSECGAEGKLSQ